MALQDLLTDEIRETIGFFVKAIGTAGGSVRGAPFTFSGSTLTIGEHTTVGFEGEAMDGWASNPFQLVDTNNAVNQINSEEIRLDLSPFAGLTVYVLARPSKRGDVSSRQSAQVEIITDILNRPLDGSTKLSVLLGTCTIDSSGNIASVDISSREGRIDTIQEIIDAIGNPGTFDHGLLTGLGDDDHAQYILTSGGRVFLGDQSLGGFRVTNLGAPINPDDAARLSDITGVTDHGLLTGLGDDDHTQYILVSGSRPFSADQSMGGFALKDMAYAKLDEKPSVPGGAPVAGTARFWVRNDTPNVPMFTDDSGNDFVIQTGGSSSQIFSFQGLLEDLAVGDVAPIAGFRLPPSGEHGAYTPKRVRVRVDTAGVGTTTIELQTSSTLTGPRTTRATINLDTSTEVEVSSFLGWTPADDEYIFLNVTAVGSTPPKDLSGELIMTEAIF